jgi:two-component system, chemotaxis family, CheB/CheR fusion protein
VAQPQVMPDPNFEALLTYLRETRGFDFTGYKRSSLMRRVNRRMAQAGSVDYADYLDHLQVRPDEFASLFNTILINVTGFFRDPEVWEYLRLDVLPALLAGKPADADIRVWSAGCASGEEAFTLAIILAELVGDSFRDRVKIYATDVDEDALSEARQGTYLAQQLEAVPADLRERYFDRRGDRFMFRKDLRRSVIFGRNDLVQDAPISRIDLLVCRNTLMYLNAETQARVLSRFHFALADTGVLLLGKAEMLLSHGQLFQPLDLKRRAFVKVTKPGAAYPPGLAEDAAALSPTEVGPLDQLRDQAFSMSTNAQVVVTADGLVALTNRHAEVLFGVSSRDVGRPFRDLELSYKPVELRRHIERAQMERRIVQVPDVELSRAGMEPLHLEVQISPLIDTEAGLLGVSLSFHDVTDARRLRDELEHAHRQLEGAYEQLQSTNEELETTNEELQSTVEELETTNEELQSTNEELETMNEELQSTNDELQNINDQLHESTAGLDAANAFLEAILTSLQAGVVVLDQDLRVRIWNRRAADLWGLRREETVGRHFLTLDIGLPLEPLQPLIRTVLADSDEPPQEIELTALTRRGRTVLLRVTCARLAAHYGTGTGAILTMESEPASERSALLAE